ncbi:MAG TPA: hypothetical protein VJS44_01625 [Pyrinomonadaceae bacterium]|nr:hypothetical protein [Pyrinomonadaceae bacterium]
MEKEVAISQESFEALLGWLDPCRESAGQKYETIRKGLIKVFIARGCSDAEHLADLTINRVMQRLPDIRNGYVGEPVRYFHGVARKVVLEYRRRKELAAELPPITPVNEQTYTSAEYDCLSKCLGVLTPEQRELVLDYYVHEKRLKIIHHKQLSAEQGLSATALRVKVHRIRVNLQKCVMECVQNY